MLGSMSIYTQCASCLTSNCAAVPNPRTPGYTAPAEQQYLAPQFQTWCPTTSTGNTSRAVLHINNKYCCAARWKYQSHRSARITRTRVRTTGSEADPAPVRPRRAPIERATTRPTEPRNGPKTPARRAEISRGREVSKRDRTPRKIVAYRCPPLRRPLARPPPLPNPLRQLVPVLLGLTRSLTRS